MKTLKKLLLGTTLFSLALAGCGTKEAPIAGKKYSYSSIAEVSVDDGFYDGDDGFNGKDKTGFARLIAPRIGNPFQVDETTVGGLKYNGKDIKVYGVNYKKEGVTVMGAYLGATDTENVYNFYSNKAGFDYEIMPFACEMGHYYHENGTIVEEHVSVASVSEVTYNKDDESLTFAVSVVDTYTINDDSTVKNASFTLVWKKA